MSNKPITANLTTEITNAALSLAALFGTTARASKYSNYENCRFTNRGSTDLTVYIYETGYTAVAANSNTLAQGESMTVSFLNTSNFSLKGAGASDSLDFYGEALS